jgi:hypothetical protein
VNADGEELDEAPRGPVPAPAINAGNATLLAPCF